jgi:hypothetical protein
VVQALKVKVGDKDQGRRDRDPAGLAAPPAPGCPGSHAVGRSWHRPRPAPPAAPGRNHADSTRRPPPSQGAARLSTIRKLARSSACRWLSEGRGPKAHHPEDVRPSSRRYGGTIAVAVGEGAARRRRRRQCLPGLPAWRGRLRHSGRSEGLSRIEKISGPVLHRSWIVITASGGRHRERGVPVATNKEEKSGVR